MSDTTPTINDATRTAIDAGAKLLPSIGPRSFTLETQCDNDPSPWIGQTFTINPDVAIGFLKLESPDGPWALVALDPLKRKLNKWTDRQTGESKSSDEVAAVFFPNSNGPKNCRNWIMEQNRRGFKVYYHVNPVGKANSGDYYPKKKAADHRIIAARYLQFDRDPVNGESYDAILDSVRTGLGRSQLKPTFLVRSGRGVQGLLRLAAPIMLKARVENGKDDPNVAQIANHNRGLARNLGADKTPVAVSWIFALPGVIAFPNLDKVKRGATPLLTELLEYNADAVVALEQIPPWDGNDATPASPPASTALAPTFGQTRTPTLDAGGIDRRFRDIADKHSAKLTTERLELLKRLAAVEFDKINRNLTPDDCKLPDVPKVQAMYCVKKPDDVLIDADGRPSGRKPDCGYTDSEPMVAFAGEALRQQSDLLDICGILSNRNLAISRHVYKDDNDVTAQFRAIVRAVATAICTEDLPAKIEAPPGIVPLSEDHLSHELVSQFGNQLRYVNEWGQWMQWDGTRWKAEKTLRVFDMAREICRAAVRLLPPDKKANWLGEAKLYAALERIAKSDRRTAITADVFDTRIDLLNTPEYIVDLNTGHTLPHDPNLYCTMSTAVSPAPLGTPCPLWMKFLSEVTGDDADYVAFLQRAVGYTLTGEIKEHSLFFGHGTGGNGKGVFNETFRYILGDYATSIPISSLVVTSSQQHPTDLAGLRGARMVTADETEQGQQWAESKIKYMTGGSKIKARFMRQDFFEFDPQFKLWIYGNHQPSLSNVDEAIRRRLHLLPFNVTIPDDRKDKDLVMKLRAEAPAILRWMVDGCLLWRRNGLKPPSLITDATMKYLEGEDYIGQWLAAQTVASADGRAKVGDLFESWRHFASQNNIPPNTTKWLSSQLRPRFGDSRKSDGNMILFGVKFNDAERNRIESWRQSKEEDRRLRKEALRKLGTVVQPVSVVDEESPF